MPADPVKGPSGIVYDMAYGARAALALQEYYNFYQTGQNPRVPGNAEVDRLVSGINGTADVEKQRAAFFEIEKYMSENLPSLPLYYQQLFVYESTRVNRNGHGYGNAQYNYDWGIIDWTVTPDASGKQVLYTNTGPIEFFQNPWFNPAIFMPSKVLWSRLITADGALTPNRPQLAESYTVSPDGKTATFTLRRNLTWHDGSPFTVEDVKWSVELASKIPTVHQVFKTTFQSLAGYKAYVDGTASSISGIKTSGNTITFTFEVLDPNMLLTFSQFAPLPKKYLDGVDPLKFQQHQYWQYPIGSGPFKIGEVQMNDYLVMVPFDKYCEGVAKIDQIVCYPSFENDVNLVKNAAAGKLDYGFTKNVADVAALEAMNNMRVVPVDIPYTRFLWFNMFPKK
jgi:peptide/nickel transport system substrate-binding protein